MAKTWLHENARLEAKRRLNEHHWIPNMNEHLIHNEHEEQNDVIIYRSKDGKIIVSLMNCDGNVWLNQAQIATLFATSKQNVGQHISNILKENELDANSVVKNYFTTASDGKQYNVTYYSLPMIIAIGFRVRGIRGTQFRQWANLHLAEYMIKGFTMDYRSITESKYNRANWQSLLYDIFRQNIQFWQHFVSSRSSNALKA